MSTFRERARPRRLGWRPIAAFALCLLLLILGAAARGPAQAADAELVVGSEVDFPPFALGQADGKPGGFTVELWEAVAQEMGLRYRYRVRPFAELLQEFRDGRIDVLINVAQTPQRAEFAAFSVPNVVSHGALFARKGVPGFQSEAELEDRSIIVLEADLGHEYARAAGFRRLTTVTDVASGMRLLAAGGHDGMLVSRLVGLQTLKELGLRDIAPVGPPVRGVVQRFSFAVRRDRPELLALINEGLAATRTNGRFEAIYETWFAPLDPRAPTPAQMARYLVPAAGLLALLLALLVYQRRVARQLGASAALLRERQDTLTAAQRVAQLGNWSGQRGAGVLGWSDELFRLYGIPAGAVGRDSFLAAVHPDDRAALAERIDAALAQGAPFETEYRIVLADGSERWVLHRVEADGGGRLIGTVLDITSRKRAEAFQLDQRRVLESIAEGATLPDVANQLLAALEAQVPGAMGGVLLVDDTGQGLTALAGARLPPACRAGPECLRIGPRAGSCGTACHRNAPVIVGDTASDPLWADLRHSALAQQVRACWSQPIVGRNGRVLGTLSLSHRQPRQPLPEHLHMLATQAHLAALAIERQRAEDELRRVNESLELRVRERTAELEQARSRLEAEVAVRQRAEQASADARNHLDSVINAMRDPVFVKDEAHRWVLLNDALCALVGRPRDELIGRSDFDVFPPEQARVFWDRDDEVFARGGENLNEESLTDSAGAVHWIQTKKSLHVEPGGRRLLVGIIRDITERRQAEIDLRAAKEAAEDAARAKSAFLANMSHEIRTPLQGVLGAMDLLAETPLDAPQRRYIDVAKTSATMLLGVIDEILDLSRLEGGMLPIEALDFDVHRAVEDAAAVLARRAHAKRIELACSIAPDVPSRVAGDPSRLRQILVNLIGNAVKFTERGQVVVDCSVAAAADQRGVRLRFEVIDSGIGIAPELQPALFEPFTQADASTSRRYGGSGLGLSIARRLVERMGGSIGVQSQPGRGSRFWFELPFAPATAPAPPPAARLDGLHALVVDDNDHTRAILMRYLGCWGVRCAGAADPVQALAELRRAAQGAEPYELALLDLELQGAEGWTLAQAVRSDAALAALPLIVLCTAGHDSARMAGLGISIALDKPVRQSSLRDALAAVRGEPAQEPAHALPGPPAAPARQRFGGEHVLLVEDNDTARELGLEMLRGLGLSMEATASGAEAVAKVRADRFDAVLMDVQMPEMDGYTATGLLRRWEQENGRARLPIIGLTAHALPADRERCLAAGMDDHVAKPYNAAAIGAALARWLRPGDTEPAAGGGDDERGTATPPPALDNLRLAEVRRLMGPRYPMLLAKAADSIDQQGAALAHAGAGADRAAVRAALHQLKNTAGEMGARTLHQIAADTEQDAKVALPAAAALDRVRCAARDAAAELRSLARLG